MYLGSARRETKAHEDSLQQGFERNKRLLNFEACRVPPRQSSPSASLLEAMYSALCVAAIYGTSCISSTCSRHNVTAQSAWPRKPLTKLKVCNISTQQCKAS